MVLISPVIIRTSTIRKEPKMKKSLKRLLLVCAALAVLAFAGCEKKGPMQKAGEKADKAVQKTGDAVKDAAADTKDAVENK